MKIKVLKFDNTSSTIDVNLGDEKDLNVNIDRDIALINRVKNQALKQGTKAVKTRSQVRGGKAKPFKQKGTGRARQGSTNGPHQTGGGVSHGPKMDTTSLKLNKKYKSLVLKKLLVNHISNDVLSLVEVDSDQKKIKQFFTSYDKSLFVYAPQNIDSLKYLNNLQGVDLVNITRLSVFDLLNFKNIFVDAQAKESLLNILNS